MRYSEKTFDILLFGRKESTCIIKVYWLLSNWAIDHRFSTRNYKYIYHNLLYWSLLTFTPFHNQLWIALNEKKNSNLMFYSAMRVVGFIVEVNNFLLLFWSPTPFRFRSAKRFTHKKTITRECVIYTNCNWYERMFDIYNIESSKYKLKFLSNIAETSIRHTFLIGMNAHQ